MGITSYPTPIDTVSTDIDAVGGKDAYLGMLREDELGRRYVLHKAAEDIYDKTWIAITQEYNGVYIANSNGYFQIGGNITGTTVPSGSYFWCCVYGTAPMRVKDEAATREYTMLIPVGGVAQRAAVNSSTDYFCGMILQDRYDGLVDTDGDGVLDAVKLARCLINPQAMMGAPT